jgi:hypothetical protein
MTWFAWKGYNGGKAVDIAGTQEKQAVLLGFHGYGTEAKAEANPNDVAGLFPDPILGGAQEEFVNAIIADYGFAKKAGEQPGGPNANILNPVNDAKGDVSYAENTFPGLAQIGGFFSRLTQANTWLRIAEVLLGVGLIIVSLAKLADGTSVGNTAQKAGKAIRIL